MFISLQYVLLLSAVLILYYILPMNIRWVSLLMGSLAFFFYEDRMGLPLLLAVTVISYFSARIIERNKAGWILILSVALILLPLLLTRTFVRFTGLSLIAPLGVSFFTLQIISYLVDVYSGKTEASTSFPKYLLFITFFPQILQGPIPRYDLMDELWKGHSFSEEKAVKGFQLILWGFFLKLMIADRAGIFVDGVYADYASLSGTEILIAGILYSIQLYTDFSSCVCIAKGSAEMFGITLGENFMHPYFSDSVKDFWRRWHISLSMFLRDYIYIPLGGSRKGRIRKYLNILITFFVSGLWHGGGLNFIFWGLLHGVYEIAGDVIKPVKSRIVTFLFVMLAWIIFRAESLMKGLDMIRSIFTRFDISVLFNGALITEDLPVTEWMILLSAILILFIVSLIQERGQVIRDRILSFPHVVRGTIYIAAILGVILFGKYGSGFDAGSFIYAGF